MPGAGVTLLRRRPYPTNPTAKSSPRRPPFASSCSLPGPRTEQAPPELTTTLHTPPEHSALWHCAARVHVELVGRVGVHVAVLPQKFPVLQSVSTWQAAPPSAPASEASAHSIVCELHAPFVHSAVVVHGPSPSP